MKILFFINIAADSVVSVFSGISAIGGITISSLACAMFILLIFKFFSNQEEIKAHKNSVIGYFLEIGLFRDQFTRTIGSQINMLKHNFLYLAYMMPPLMIVIIPLIIVTMQIEFRTGNRPLKTDESFIIQAKLDDKINSKSFLDRVQIDVSPNILIETLPLYIEKDGKIFLRGKILNDIGPHYLQVRIQGTNDVIKKKIMVSSVSARYSKVKGKLNSWKDIFINAEGLIPMSSHFEYLSISYSPAKYSFFVWRISPIIYFIILTLALSFIIKPFMNITI